MAVGVVEVLEVIDVEHHDRGRSTALGHRLVGFVHGLVEGAAIGQRGQGVGAGFRGVTDQLLRLGLQLGFGGLQLLLHPLVGLDELVHRLDHGGRLLVLRRVEFVGDAAHERLVLVDVGCDVVGQFAQPFEDLARSVSASSVRGRPFCQRGSLPRSHQPPSSPTNTAVQTTTTSNIVTEMPCASSAAWCLAEENPTTMYFAWEKKSKNSLANWWQFRGSPCRGPATRRQNTLSNGQRR